MTEKEYLGWFHTNDLRPRILSVPTGAFKKKSENRPPQPEFKRFGDSSPTLLPIRSIRRISRIRSLDRSKAILSAAKRRDHGKERKRASARHRNGWERDFELRKLGSCHHQSHAPQYLVGLSPFRPRPPKSDLFPRQLPGTKGPSRPNGVRESRLLQRDPQNPDLRIRSLRCFITTFGRFGLFAPRTFRHYSGNPLVAGEKETNRPRAVTCKLIWAYQRVPEALGLFPNRFSVRRMPASSPSVVQSPDSLDSLNSRSEGERGILPPTNRDAMP